MYTKRVQIINYGPIDQLDIEFPFGGDTPKPVVLVGSNGSGKSILLSHIVNGLISAQGVVYPDTPEVEIGKVFKIRSSTYIKNGTDGYFARVDFEEGLFTQEITSGLPKKNYQTVPTGFAQGDAKDAWDRMDTTKHDLLISNFSTNNASKIEYLFSNNCVQYFPHNRFEEPAWLNEGHLNSDAELIVTVHMQGSTTRRIIKCSSLKENQNWLLDLLFDRAVLETHTVSVPLPVQEGGQSVPVPVQIGPSGTATGVYGIALEVVRWVMKGELGARFGVGRRGNRVVSLEGANGNLVPNVFQLSSGETSLLSLFLSILRDFDLSHSPLTNASDIRGTVLVDEIDLHLHAVHQHEVLPRLIRMFPNIQFIVTTHSPLFVLGMAQTFGEEGFALYRMPQGRQISPEEFSEFGDAYQAFAATSRFSDEIRAAVKEAQSPILYMEGKTDVQYLKRAAELLGKQPVLASMELDERGGEGKLKNIWNAVKNLPISLVPRTIVLLHDCDYDAPDQTKDKRFRRTIPYQSDHPIEKGIENLFAKATLGKALDYKPDFIDITEAHHETIRGKGQLVPEKWAVNEDEKNNLCNWLCENGAYEDFQHFQVVFDLLEEALGSVEIDACSSA